MATKTSIFTEHLREWLHAKGHRQTRRAITEHICYVAKVHPKSVPRSFRRVQMRDPATPQRRGRKTIYTPDVTAAVKALWDIGGQPCGENLHPMMREFVAILKRDRLWSWGQETTDKLLAMSEATVKRRVAGFVRTTGRTHGKSTTSPGAIHALVPIRTGPWDGAPMGTMQIDTVAHCGGSVAGDFVYTVNATDVATLWGSRRAQWNKGQTATVASLEAMEEQTPFPIIEWHPDSGSEFVNWHCMRWCAARRQELTRSRPNRKNDNCFVEERNGHCIRRWIGYRRFDIPEVVASLNAVYAVLTPYLNHFVASRRIVSKERIGARWKVERELRAMTPYQRVLGRADVSDVVKDRLRQKHAEINPLLMKQEIDRRLHTMFKNSPPHHNVIH